ncbi:diguanylate cyclase [bacterium]|nr:diguanylate cyclase [bacterium]
MEFEKTKKVLEKFIESESWHKICEILVSRLNSSFFWVIDTQGNFIYRLQEDRKFCQMIKNNLSGSRGCQDSFQFLRQQVIEKKKSLVNNCHAGFLKFASPLMVDNEIIGILGGCQLIDLNLDFELYQATALELSLNIEDFLFFISKESSISSSNLEAEIELVSLATKNTLESITRRETKERQEKKEVDKVRDFYDLFEACRELVLNLETKKLYPTIVEMARKAMNTQICSLMLVDQENKEVTIKAACGLSEKVIKETCLSSEEGLVGYVIKSSQPLLVKDVETDPRFKRRHQSERYHTKSLIISPLKIEDKVMGVLCMNNKEDHTPFNEDDLNLLSIICGHAAIAIENSKAYEKIKKDKAEINIQAKELSILHDIGEELILRHTPREILDLSLTQILKNLSCDLASYFIWEGGEVRAKVCSLYSLEEESLQQLKEHFKKSMPNLSFFQSLREEFSLEVISKSSKRPKDRDILAYLAYSLSDNGSFIGILALASFHKRIFLENEKNLFSLISKQISVNIKRALVYEETKILTERDDLTNVYNYRYFKKNYPEEFKKVFFHYQPLSLIMLDFDHLKMYNDRYGHQQGSFLIKKIASLIERELKDKGWVSRFGGDEFSIILPNTPKDDAFKVASKIRESINNTTVNLNGDLHKLTASLGVATFSGRETQIRDEKDLLELADKALYQAKDQGRNKVCQYHE